MMTRKDLEWMETMAEVYFTQICVAIRKLCALKGVPHLADDVIGRAFETAVEKSRTYNPRLASFDTWVVGHAKWYLAELFQAKDYCTGAAGVHHTGMWMFAETPVVFSDEPSDELATMPSPAVQFRDPFDDAPAPWVDGFVARLSDLEKRLLELLLLNCGEKYPVAQAARDLGVSPALAKKTLDSVRAKAREAICEQHSDALG